MSFSSEQWPLTATEPEQKRHESRVPGSLAWGEGTEVGGAAPASSCNPAAPLPPEALPGAAGFSTWNAPDLGGSEGPPSRVPWTRAPNAPRRGGLGSLRSPGTPRWGVGRAMWVPWGPGTDPQIPHAGTPSVGSLGVAETMSPLRAGDDAFWWPQAALTGPPHRGAAETSSHPAWPLSTPHVCPIWEIFVGFPVFLQRSAP